MTWTFTQEHLKEKLLTDASLVGKEIDLKNDFPLALRLVGFLPFENYFWVSIRKATHHPWGIDTNEDGTIKKKKKEEGEKKNEGETADGETPDKDEKQDEKEDQYLFLNTLKVF